MGKNSRYDEKEVFSGQILLFRRKFNGKENPFWQAKIKVPSSKGHMTISTRSKYPDEAERIAIQHFRKAEARTQSGYPLKQVTFERAAKEYGDWKGQQYMTGRCSKEILDYHKVILRKSLVPFFLGKYLHKITSYDIEEYQGQRQNFGTKKGKRASPATLNRDNAVIRAVFKYAKQKKYITDIPIIDNISAFAQRPSFTTKEAEIFKEKLVEWVDHTHEFDGPHVMDYRKLFRLYCLVIYFSGIRPGKEMASLRWDDYLGGSIPYPRNFY